MRLQNVPNGIGGYVSGVCDPTGGFEFTKQNERQFREDRLVELAVKYTW
jgi:hypothetical protein